MPSTTTSETPTPTLYFAYGSNLSLTQMHTRCPHSTYYGLGVLYGYRWIINERGYANIVPITTSNPDSNLVPVVPGSVSVLAGASPHSHPHALSHAPATGRTAGASHSSQEPERETRTKIKIKKPRKDISSSTTQTPPPSVHGILYTLTRSDESALDSNEGVPFAYTKTHLYITVLSSPSPFPSPFSSCFPSFCLPFPFPSFSLPFPSPNSKKFQVQALTYIDTLRTTPSIPNPEYIHRMNRGIREAVSKGLQMSYVRDVLRIYIPEESRESGECEDQLRDGGCVKKRGRWLRWIGCN
ncbi:AIG2 family protein [Sclerotinia borealis F-4128]|uniref:gamma-glutamylcyclotransferase n=1 Tax=Sclerotinia borealis (strain F-4128) TaxID=1432307 RepID=W9CKE1_SCLBF|nr:AIG2 family protein [Sclerotinia borealis F-4128]